MAVVKSPLDGDGQSLFALQDSPHSINTPRSLPLILSPASDIMYLIGS